MKRFAFFALLPLVVVGLQSCAALGFGELLAVEEVGALTVSEGELMGSMVSRGILTRSLTGGLMIADEAAFYAELSELRMSSTGVFRTPSLYVVEGGKNITVGEVISNNSIRFLRGAKTVELEGTIYRVNGSRVNVRTGAGTNYNAFTNRTKDQLVLVVDEYEGWKKVRLNENQYGWMSAKYLIPALVTSEKKKPATANEQNTWTSSTPPGRDAVHQVNVQAPTVVYSQPGNTEQRISNTNNSVDFVKPQTKNNSSNQSIGQILMMGSEDKRYVGNSSGIQVNGSGSLLLDGDCIGDVVLSGSGNLELTGSVSGNVYLNGSGDIHISGSVNGNVIIRGSGDVKVVGMISGSRNVYGSGSIQIGQ